MFCALPECYCITDTDNLTVRLIQPSRLTLIKIIPLVPKSITSGTTEWSSISSALVTDDSSSRCWLLHFCTSSIRRKSGQRVRTLLPHPWFFLCVCSLTFICCRLLWYSSLSPLCDAVWSGSDIPTFPTNLVSVAFTGVSLKPLGHTSPSGV